MQASLNYRWNKPRILIVGCGDVGGRLLPSLLKTHRVFVLTSQQSKAENFRNQGVVPLVGDLDRPHTLSRLAKLAPTVIHLAPPNPEGLRDKRTQNLIRILSHGGQVRKFIYISTSGVYGDCGGDWAPEERSPRPQSPRGQRRLDAERQVRAWGVRARLETIIFRVPGIYAGNRLPIDRLRAGTPALLPQEDVYTNHIHADDLARLIYLAIFRPFTQRIFNASDDSHMKMGEYFDLVANTFALEHPPRVSRSELEGLVSPMMLSFMKESRKLKNERLDEFGFRLKYPTVADFLKTQK
jgi:nucleoside-diphosphate-sugar epimerase